MIKKSQQPIIVKAHNDSFNRKVLEYGKFDTILSIEAGKKSDSLKQIDSGLNHILAKIASKNKISIGIDLKEIESLEPKEKAVRLSKIRQNIEICKKSKTPLKVINSNNKTLSFNLLTSLGASTQQAKQAISF